MGQKSVMLAPQDGVAYCIYYLWEPEELKQPDFQARPQQYALRPKLYGMSGWISISGSL